MNMNEEFEEQYESPEDYEIEQNITSKKDYEMPVNIGASIDSSTGEVIEDSKLGPLETIRLIAKQLKIETQDPARNCKYCYGRGYTGVISKTQQPIPCKCIYPKKVRDLMFKYQMTSAPNRRARRSAGAF